MLQKRIIHIFHDDKFIDGAIKLFEEVAPNISVYYVIKKSGIPFQYVKSEKVIRIDWDDAIEKEALLDNINSNINNVLFIHALDNHKQEIVLQTNSKIKKVWLMWGYDLYLKFPLLMNNIYMPQTKAYLNINSHYKTRILYSSVGFFMFKNPLFTKNISDGLLRTLNEIYNTKFYTSATLFDIVVPIVPTEFSIIKKMKLKGQLAPFEYACLEDMLGDKINDSVYMKPNILVGNSADPANNHLDIFEKLSKLNLEGREIYVPLSYGGYEDYKNKVINEGFRLFKNNFKPLVDFLPIDQYNDIVSSCGTLILNHIRQQALGNIVVMGYLGAKIYLNRKSPVYKYLRQEGIKVNSVDKLTSAHFQKVLSPVTVELNKRLIFDLYSKHAVHEKIKILLNRVLS